MKKRLISLLLCVIMVSSSLVLVSCGDDIGGLVDPNANIPTEITIYGIKNPNTTDTAIKEVEAALTEISARKHNISINLLLFNEEEYAAILFNKVQSSMSKYNTALRDITAEADLSKIKDVEYGSNVTVETDIPSEVVNSTLDIFLVYTPDADSPTLDPDSEYYNPCLANGGMFEVLYDQQALAPLNSFLKSGNYSSLKSNAYDEALAYVVRPNYATRDNTEGVVTDTYAIPNNYAYGGYEFIMFDNTYIDPLFSADDKSLLAKPLVEKRVGTSIIKDDPDELKALKLELTKLKENGEIPEDVEIEIKFQSYEEFNDYIRAGGKFCIGLIDGDRSLMELCSQSGQFDVYQRDVNTIKGVDLCRSMFCISPSAGQVVNKKLDTSRIEAALKVLILLNTDSDFRNIFQYGVKDTHYSLGKDGVVHVTGMPGNVYSMNPLYCGNMFLVYPSDDMDAATQLLASNKWLLGKLQSNEVLTKYRGS